MNEYIQLLLQFGLTDKECAIYVALLELGEGDVSEIAAHAGVKRPTAYFVIDDLIRKGFVSPLGGAVKRFVAEKPQKLLAVERAKVNQLEKMLPGLMGLASKSKHKPSVRFFTGIDGVRAVYEESLLQPANSEVLAMGNAKAVESNIRDFGEWYIQRRVQGKIRMRAIATTDDYSVQLAARDKDELRQTRYLDEALFTQDVEVNIYGNKVAMISFVEGELLGIIIESKVFAAGHRQMFELLWKLAREI